MKKLPLFCLVLLVTLTAGCMPGGSAGPTGTVAALPVSPLPPVTSATHVDTQTGPSLRVVTAREFLSMRIRPSASSARIKKLAPGAVVEVLGEEGEFSSIVEPTTGYTGYVLTKYLAALPENGAPPTPAPPNTPGRYRVAAEEFLSLRALPSTDAQRLLTIEAGSIIDVLAFEGNFARVNIGEASGYVLAAYLEPAAGTPAPPPNNETYTAVGPVAVIAAENYASLRALPDAASERLLKLPRGGRVIVISQKDGFAHVEDEATGERGYVLARLLVTEEEFRGMPRNEKPDTRYIDAMEHLTLLKSPSTAAEALGALRRGERVTVLGREGDFALIEDAAGRRGYVLDGYLSDAPVREYSAERYTVAAEEYLSLRAKPDAGAERLDKIASGAQVEVTGLDGLFARVRFGGNEGYVLSGYLKSPEGAAYQSLDIVKPTAAYAPHMVGEDLAALAKRYPDRLRIVSAGRSLEGRDIPAALLGNPDAEHHILIQASIHGREHMTALLAVAQIEDMLARPQASLSGQTYKDLLDAVCFHILPMANPDGVAISQTRKASAAVERIYQSDKMAGLTDLTLPEYLAEWKANAAGVDLNRNFDAGWRTLAGPGAPSFARYKGEAPADQPETAALAAYSKKHDFDATVSYHSYGSLIYWEYGGDQTVLDASRSLARAVRAVTRYPLAGSGGLDAGGYKDWAMEMRSIPSITVETGARPCPLPLDEFDMMWRRNREVLPALAAWALEH